MAYVKNPVISRSLRKNVNNDIMNQYALNTDQKRNNIASEIKQSLKNHKANQAVLSLSDDVILKLYDTAISVRQRNVQRTGSFLEDYVSNMLLSYNILFLRQVAIDNNGFIIPTHPVICRKHVDPKRKPPIQKKKKKRQPKPDTSYHVVDFLIKSNETSTHISECAVISCKSTCRERWSQDNWMLQANLKPALYLLCILTDDYPSRTRFLEREDRKLVTAFAKEKDDRLYKMDYNDVIIEIVDWLLQTWNGTLLQVF